MKYAFLAFSLLVSGLLYAEVSTDMLLTQLTEVQAEIRRLKVAGKPPISLLQSRDQLHEQVIERLAKTMIEGQDLMDKALTRAVDPYSTEGKHIVNKGSELAIEIEKILRVLNADQSFKSMALTIFRPKSALKK